MKRKLLTANEALNIMSQSTSTSLSRIKNSPRYAHYIGMKVTWLRQNVRGRGYRKWYCLKKTGLVGLLIIDESVRTVVNVFRAVAEGSRGRFIAQRVAEGRDNKCPICLTPLEDIQPCDLFVHDRMVFCKSDIIEYMSSGCNFSNPITRKAIARHSVQSLGCDSLLQKYGQRETLRRRVVDSSTYFFFLENEVVICYREMLEAVSLSASPMFEEDTFRELYYNFDHQVKQMFHNDSLRTVCVLKGLRSLSGGMGQYAKDWSSSIISRYLKLSGV